jgi:hypothetical protein
MWKLSQWATTAIHVHAFTTLLIAAQLSPKRVTNSGLSIDIATNFRQHELRRISKFSLILAGEYFSSKSGATIGACYLSRVRIIERRHLVRKLKLFTHL